MKIKNIITIIILFVAIHNNYYLLAKSNSDLTKFQNAFTNSECLTHSESFVQHVIFANPNDPYPTELWTDRTVSPDWASLDFYDIAKEIQSIYPLAHAYLSNLKADELSIILKRLDHLLDIAKRGLLMQSKRWKSHYSDLLNKHIIGIRKAGISDLFPKQLFHSTPNCDDRMVVKDNSHYCETELSLAPNSNVTIQELMNLIKQKIINYMDEQGGQYSIIQDFKESQGEDSWTSTPQDIKDYFQQQMDFPYDSYYWGAENYYPNLAGFELTIPIWHAFTQEFLRSTHFLHNEIEKQQVCLTRFDGFPVFSKAKQTANSQYKLKRAVYDSYTLFNYFYPGKEDLDQQKIITMQLVDHMQIFDCYLLGNYFGIFGVPQNETEFIAMVGPQSETYIGGATPVFYIKESADLYSRSYPSSEVVKEVVSKILSENWCSNDHAILLEEALQKAQMPFNLWCCEKSAFKEKLNCNCKEVK